MPPSTLKGKFLYNAVSCHNDHSKYFTLHPLVAELFIATPNQFLLEAFSSISATLQLLREDFSLPYQPLSILIYTAE